MTRLVLASARLPELVRKALRTLLNGVWLGVLGDRSLQAIDERYYDASPEYRTAEWNGRGLAPWELEAVQALFRPGARLLVVGCGGGREVLGLLEAGYDAFGCESHPALCAFADTFLTERGHPGRIAGADRDAVPPGPECDGLIAGWGAYSLIHGRAARVAFLRAASGRVAPGGPVLLSGFGCRAHGRELALTARLANALRRLRGAAPIDLGDTLGPNRLHVFTPAQLQGEAEAAAFTVASWREVAPADGDTAHVAVALRPR